MKLDSKEACYDDGHSAGEAAGHRMEMAKTAKPEGYATMDTGQGIDFGTEDEWNLVEEDVANDAAACSGECAHNDGDPHRLACCQGFLDTNDGEHAEAKGVEEEPCVVAANDVLLQAPNEDECDEGDEEIDGILHPKDGHTEHHVAQGAAADGCGESHDKGAEEVEILGRSQADAGDGKGERADIVEHNDEIVIERQDVSLELLFHIVQLDGC